MNEIKTLADQLREKMRNGETQNSQAAGQKPAAKPPVVDDKPQKPPKVSTHEEKAAAFFQALETFQLEGTEKSLIRVDSRTMNLLKHIKLAKGIDMNRFIVYCVHQYIGQHPWLPDHIHQTLKNTKL